MQPAANLASPATWTMTTAPPRLALFVQEETTRPVRSRASAAPTTLIQASKEEEQHLAWTARPVASRGHIQSS